MVLSSPHSAIVTAHPLNQLLLPAADASTNPHVLLYRVQLSATAALPVVGVAVAVWRASPRPASLLAVPALSMSAAHLIISPGSSSSSLVCTGLLQYIVYTGPRAQDRERLASEICRGRWASVLQVLSLKTNHQVRSMVNGGRRTQIPDPLPRCEPWNAFPMS